MEKSTKIPAENKERDFHVLNLKTPKSSTTNSQIQPLADKNALKSSLFILNKDKKRQTIREYFTRYTYNKKKENTQAACLPAFP